MLATVGGNYIDPQTWARIYQSLGFEAVGAIVCPAKNDTALHFIDVGQGDAVLIQQNDAFCLIDAGTRESETDLLNYLDSVGVQSIKLLVMTHPHADHIGSMRAVLRHVKVEQVLLPDFSKSKSAPSFTLERVLEEIASQKIRAVTAQIGQSFSIGKGSLTVLRAGVPTEGFNDVSPVLRFNAPNITFLDTGDGEIAVEENAQQGGLPLDSVVFKAAHHGSNTANSPTFLRAVGPEYVVVSCGQANNFGHPNAEALDSFSAVGAQILRTDQRGNIVILGTPQGVKIHWAASEQEEAA